MLRAYDFHRGVPAFEFPLARKFHTLLRKEATLCGFNLMNFRANGKTAQTKSVKSTDNLVQ